MDVFEQAWKDYGEEAARLLEQYKPKFSKIVRQWTYSEVDFEDTYSEVVIWRLPRLIETWDPTKGDMMAYIFASISWYCAKRAKKIHNERSRNEYLIIDEELSVKSHVAANFEILDELSEYDAYLLYHHYVEGFTFREIAEAIGCSVSVARTHTYKALETAKEIFDQ